METATPRIKKSMKMTSSERKALNKYCESFDTKIDCAEALKISRQCLHGVMTRGSGRQQQIEKIREALKQFQLQNMEHA